MDPNKPVSPSGPSRQSLSPEKPKPSSGKKQRKRRKNVAQRPKSSTPPPNVLSENTSEGFERSASPTAPSLQSMSPERPDLSSGKPKDRFGRSASPTAPSLQSMSPERPDLSSGKPKDRFGRSASPTAPSLQSMSPERPDLSSGKPKDRFARSLQSLSPERPDLSSGTYKDRNVVPAEPSVHRRLTAKGEDKAFPPIMEDWTKEHVRDWLITHLRISPKVAQSLYDQEASGACLVSFEKQDLLELGVPPAPALQILRQVVRFNRRSELSAQHQESEESEKMPQDKLETQTVTTDSGFHSESASVLHETRDDFEEQFTEHEHLQIQSLSPIKRAVCVLRPFDKSTAPVFYTEHHFLPTVAGPNNLLDPVHEYKLLPDSNEISQREVLFEFTNEIFCFAASCMNSRTNGTIHFGVKDELGQEHGQIIGHQISSMILYSEAFESDLSKYFEQEHIHSARMCIRPPVFVQVQCEDGTASDKWVIEVDVVPLYSETQESVFYTILDIPSTEKNQHQSKVECLFVREGSRKVNILSDSNPRVFQDKIKEISDKVKRWASARRAAEEMYEPPPPNEHQGQRLKQLITCGRDSLSDFMHVFVVTDKCHSSQLEHMDFLKELNLFVVLDFDPESGTNGTCHIYRRNRAANLHFPQMYTTQDRASVIANLNLFKQTSWVFCNGHAGHMSNSERPLSQHEWLKNRSGCINNMVSFLCSPDLLPKHSFLVLIILHSPISDISSPILETFCALYRSLGGMDNMLCLCKDATVFSHWKNLVEVRCKEDITNKCIYTLSLHEISSTIKKLKEPQTRASRRFLASTGSSSVLLEKKEEEMMTDLEILCENECEKTEIETNKSFEEFKKNTEEVFYRGGQVSWWNFYLSEQPGSLPFIKRDKYGDLYQLICPVQGYTSPCVVVPLFHHPGCGGTTLAKHILWNLKNRFRCAVVKNQMATNKDIALQVRTLLTYGKQEQPGYTPVLLLVDNWYDVDDLKQCILGAAIDRNQPNNLVVLILHCERTPFPDKTSVNCYNPNVFISAKLSSKEKDLFLQKYQELKDNHEKPDTFYAFMIMKNDFSKDYISDLVNNILKDLDIGSQQGKLLSFLALLNSYVNGSYISLSSCEELVGIRNPLWRQESLEDKMNPYSTLLITFTVEEHGTYQAVRLLHQMIAENCIKVFKENQHDLSDITIDLLFCESLYRTCMGKDFLNQFIQSMLVTRTRREQGDDKNTLFSPLIENIQKEEGFDKVKKVLERAIDRFDRSATLPQALARHMCLNEKDFDSALKWALDAQNKRSNSYIADTVGQVYKSQLKMLIEHSKEAHPELLNECLQLASKAVSAFRESQELANKDEQIDPLDRHGRKVEKAGYNTSGYLGETEVIIMLLDLITELPVFSVSDRHKRDKMLQVLRGQQPITILGNSDPEINAIVTVLKDHGRFLVSLKPRLKEIFTFFEKYFIYLRPRHVPLNRETADERNKRKVFELFKKYIKLFSCSEEEKEQERERNPKLSQQQVIEDHRRDLEMMQADTFAGLLQSLSHKNKSEIIFEKWKFIFENSVSRYTSTSDTVNYILSNIVLHSIKPNCILLKKYEELVALLNDVLQKEGTRSNLLELYYLCMLLMWPSKDQSLKNFTEYSNISTYIASAKRSFHKRFSFMFPSRSAIAHFFLGKSTGLKRIVSKVKLDQILVDSYPSDGNTNFHHLWHSGLAWSTPSVQEKLLRVKGRSENGDIYVTYGANIKIMIRPAYLGDIRSGYSREEVSFYIGFTLEGPVAYDVKYEK
ncbi:sterile alpha motif domain-containing protein 9-like [Periophthalmus magnuspinnatus]|uniref:sterile alpha motif domain-containing protein 9-like n=1 Tax=Periophthalmus magnuspinnatus TaxID=409849 RepID=UPI00145A74F6|nr:sterile alpha motif domain-containing protein 9-like [Periophthalmus magnuspinnatus]